MSAFHPAVYGALYVALADHKRYRASAEAVADMYDNSATIAEYTSAIAGLQETIALLHAGDADAAVDDQLIAEDDLGPMHCTLHNTPPIPTGEQCPLCLATASADARAAEENAVDAPALIPRSREHAVMGKLLPMVADIPTASWQINTGKIQIQVAAVLPDDEVRPAMRAIAERLPGFDYREVEYVYVSHVSVEAYTVIDGVKVRIWDHAKPVAPARAVAVQDEDQPTATPARGHGQDDDEDDYIDPDAPATHAPTLGAHTAPLCGDLDADPVYSNRPTCPTCSSLRSARSQTAIEEGSQ